MFSFFRRSKKEDGRRNKNKELKGSGISDGKKVNNEMKNNENVETKFLNGDSSDKPENVTGLTEEVHNGKQIEDHQDPESTHMTVTNKKDSKDTDTVNNLDRHLREKELNEKLKEIDDAVNNLNLSLTITEAQDKTDDENDNTLEKLDDAEDKDKESTATDPAPDPPKSTNVSDATIDKNSPNGKPKIYKNNQPSTPELAPRNNAIPLPKNVANAAKTITSEAVTLFEKNHELNDTIPYVNGLKVKMNERRGSCVKPCGHGTTAILPRIPQQNVAKKETPPSSPLMEVKKTVRFTVSGIQEGEEDEKVKQEKDCENLKVATKLIDGNLGDQAELDKKNLINQEAKFQSQLNELTKELSARDAEAARLRFQMEELQRDVFAKAAGMDRLQVELNTANKEVEIVRQKIRHLENELENYRKRNSDLVEEVSSKTEQFNNYEVETQSKINELEGVIKNLRIRIETLEDQIKELKREKDELEVKHAELQTERDEDRSKLLLTLETSTKQKEEIEKKWKADFEKLRTVNILKEQELLDDFEWKLREVQQTCKKKLDEKEKLIEERLQAAYKDAEVKMGEAEKMLGQVEALKSYEMEVQQLRNRTSEQEKTLQQMRDQQEQMLQAETSLKSETKRLLNLIELEKENLQHIQRLHRMELQDKERKLKETLNQKRTEIAMYWEEKLMNECGRLKEEMEQIHNEEKYNAMETVRREKEEEFKKRQSLWENKMRDCLKEIDSLKKALDEKDEYYHEELVSVRSNTDRDIMELRRLMNKIDMTHHENYEKLMEQHDQELEKINEEHQQEIQEVESHWKSKLTETSTNLEEMKEQVEKEAQQKVQSLVEQHRNELDSQWENLVHQKSEAIKLVEDEYVSKYKTLEDQFYTQQKSHTAREIELLKTIDTLKNELHSKNSTVDDLQNNVETLEGGVQVLNQEIAQQAEDMAKVKREADQKIRSLHETIAKLLEEREKERESFRVKLMGTQKQNQETIDHLQRKCTCLTKLFEEVRQRYERRESRQEDINIISDLKQVIAEQEKDLACINEEKRYFQMRLMQLERHLEQSSSHDEEDFEDAESHRTTDSSSSSQQQNRSDPSDQNFVHLNPNAPIFIPPTIPEDDE